MRTTLRLPDELYREVRVTSAASGRTVTSFVEEALREAVARYRAPEADATFVVEPFDGDGLMPGVDLTSSTDLIEHMESR